MLDWDFNSQRLHPDTIPRASSLPASLQNSCRAESPPPSRSHLFRGTFIVVDLGGDNAIINRFITQSACAGAWSQGTVLRKYKRRASWHAGRTETGPRKREEGKGGGEKKIGVRVARTSRHLDAFFSRGTRPPFLLLLMVLRDECVPSR